MTRALFHWEGGKVTVHEGPGLEALALEIDRLPLSEIKEQLHELGIDADMPEDLQVIIKELQKW